MAKTNYRIHVISNTHWDREWLYNFQETRQMLVEMMDQLLEIMGEDPEYKAYLLDSQTVPLEDYLEIRPERRESLVRLISSGRLLVGPWYTDPECFSIGGESLVRNLTYGHRVAREFGGVMKVGYTPFSYGQNSQMPQIYKGFGIDTMLFYHGVSHDEVDNEFIFEGADGSQVLATQVSSYARYNFYYTVYRPVVYGTEPNQRVYDWKTGGLPFHLANESQAMSHHFLLDPPRGFNTDKVAEKVKALREREIEVSTTRHLAFMMGHDSSMPSRDERRIIEEARKALPEGDEIIHSSLPEMMTAVKEDVEWDKLTVLKGERRTPKPMPVSMHLYSDVLSSRTRMKRLNQQAEQLLQRWTEPWATLLWALGSEYPQGQLDLAWKTLLKCHAHDSIAGSGVDDIERDMMYRLRQVMNLSESVRRRSLEALQLRVDNSQAAQDDVLLTVFNASPLERSEVLTAVVDMPTRRKAGEFSLVDAESGEQIAVQGSTRSPQWSIVNHGGDAPAMMEAERFVCHFPAESVPALGYKTYRVDPDGLFERGGMVCGANTMENEHLWVRIENDGTLSIEHKATGRVFDGLHYFEDGGECGMAWMHIDPATNQILTSHGFPASIKLVENGPLLARYEVEYRMEIPAELDDRASDKWKQLDRVGNAARRSQHTIAMTIVSTITLRRGARGVEVTTKFNNQARNHRLRVMFPTRLETDVCHVESAFDVVEREAFFGEDSPWRNAPDVTFPMQRFVSMDDGETGLAVVNDGVREYQITQDADHAIAMTLLRAYEVNLTTVSQRWETRPEMQLSQCPGDHEFSYLIVPHAGDWAHADIFSEVERLNVPLQAAQAGAHGGELPRQQSFFSIEPANLSLSAMKRSEDLEAIVLRIYNPTQDTIDGMIQTGLDAASASWVDLEERFLESAAIKDGVISGIFEPKQIKTLKVQLN